jgi:hypothetical protein
MPPAALERALEIVEAAIDSALSEGERR